MTKSRGMLIALFCKRAADNGQYHQIVIFRLGWPECIRQIPCLKMIYGICRDINWELLLDSGDVFHVYNRRWCLGVFGNGVCHPFFFGPLFFREHDDWPLDLGPPYFQTNPAIHSPPVWQAVWFDTDTPRRIDWRETRFSGTPKFAGKNWKTTMDFLQIFAPFVNPVWHPNELWHFVA